ncbi:hypothetical protein PENFLA_c065G08809 [Penicillium flavigenum]|uniref:Uncharacterized protein n=1 Tax=Penicillium flavigenum TaxID=254877 RepID=A0A1V6SEH8_9EURO|nr:hypothetical protein PENFLA_c065G08809 [Penicillium flavigenum]
MGGGPSLTRL